MINIKYNYNVTFGIVMHRINLFPKINYIQRKTGRLGTGGGMRLITIGAASLLSTIFAQFVNGAPV